MHINWPSVRDRIFQVMGKRKLGGRDSKGVRRLSGETRIPYTTLARFLLPREYAKPTHWLRPATRQRIALSLDMPIAFLESGVGAMQLGFWPAEFAEGAEADAVHPFNQVADVMACIPKLPAPVQIRAARAAVAAVLDTVVGAGETMDADAYQCLRRLDGLLSPKRQRTA